MKKEWLCSVRCFTVLFMSFALLAACSKEEGDEGTQFAANKFQYKGKEITTSVGVQYFYGNYYSDESNNLEVYIGGDNDFMLFLDLLLPNGSEKLVSGTYTMKESFQPYTICGGGVANLSTEEMEYEIESGTIQVEVNGNNYSVNVNCVLEGGVKLHGNYTGSLEWNDETEDGGGGTVEDGNGQIAINKGGVTSMYAFDAKEQYKLLGDLFFVQFVGKGDFKDMLLSATPSVSGSKELTAGTYRYESAATSPGTFNFSINIPGSGITSAQSGTLVVKKAGSNYELTFDFTTLTGVKVNGTFSGPIPLK